MYRNKLQTVLSIKNKLDLLSNKNYYPINEQNPAQITTKKSNLTATYFSESV